MDRVFEQIKGFAEYGFPESHAASFALLTYASSYLKCHFPAAFTSSLLNSQPLGFYSSQSLIEDAKRHAVAIRRLDLHRSDRFSFPSPEGKEIQLGFHGVHGLSVDETDRILSARAEKPFKGLWDFLSRTHIRKDIAGRLALAGAFETAFGLTPRDALWRVLEFEEYRAESPTGQQSLFSACENSPFREAAPAFEGLDLLEKLENEGNAYGMAVSRHLMEGLRARAETHTETHALSKEWGTLRVLEIREKSPKGRRIRVSGLLIVRQRPPTAKGVCFATLEDETGLLDLILQPPVLEANKELFLSWPYLTIVGRVQREGNAVSVLVERIFEIHLRPKKEAPENGLFPLVPSASRL